jgi:hypothetical protein
MPLPYAPSIEIPRDDLIVEYDIHLGQSLAHIDVNTGAVRTELSATMGTDDLGSKRLLISAECKRISDGKGVYGRLRDGGNQVVVYMGTVFRTLEEKEQHEGRLSDADAAYFLSALASETAAHECSHMGESETIGKEVLDAEWRAYEAPFVMQRLVPDAAGALGVAALCVGGAPVAHDYHPMLSILGGLAGIIAATGTFVTRVKVRRMQVRLDPGLYEGRPQEARAFARERHYAARLLVGGPFIIEAEPRPRPATS